MDGVLPAANRCFICGPDNPVGLRLGFSPQGPGVAAEFVLGQEHIGWEGVIHGGLIAAVLDDAMANIWAWRGTPAVTTSISVRFRRPVRPGERLRVFAEPVGARRSAMQRARGTVMRSDGIPVAEGKGVVLIGPRAAGLAKD
ncbi:MAG: PaaI family thioesterase [Armatimonadota bacterium]|nr:PaaI family thioesterase [Armatimonadota bacterium]MDR7427797.1 PaaI family thioesterase [Armatimonadota bacterium]MDR7464015.1 PaaI family thioesterase [Armatimonadota bacterium]MDR7468899.1 PaaI family thioesterase [Armatimonadota bacterium]MDR7474860.1 PaaI family thioesterase [Armatimonadota bacterium]